MNKEKENISNIDFKELKKNLFPLMKLLRKINDGKKKKGLNAADDIHSIKNKIDFIVNNSDILLNKKFKYLYASLCLLQIQNNSYLNELKNANRKKRLREEQDDEEEEVETDSEISNNNKKTKLSGEDKDGKHKKKKMKNPDISTEQYLNQIQKRNSQKKKKQKSSNGKNKVANSLSITQKPNAELVKINHWIDMMEFVKYCRQKPYSEAALFPSLPLKTSEEDELSLFSRLENTTEEKMEQTINSYANKNKELYSRCWENLQKKENEEEEEEEEEVIEAVEYQNEENPLKGIMAMEDEEEDNEDHELMGFTSTSDPKKKSKKGEKLDKSMNIFENFLSDEDEEEEDSDDSHQDDYTDYLPNQVYRSRIWTDGIMERFKHLYEEKREERGKDSNHKRFKICTECISRFHQNLNQIPCTGESPCERCKRLGLICYYPILVKPGSVKNNGILYRLKENINNPLTHQEYNERYEVEDHDALMRHFNDRIEFRNAAYKKLVNDAHIVGDREDYLQYRLNTKIGSCWIKSLQKDKNVIPYIRPIIQKHEIEMEQQQKEMEARGERPFLGKTDPDLPSSELLDSLQYCIARRASLEKQNDTMTYKYDNSALVTLGILYEELLKYEIDKFNQPGYYQ